MTDLQKALLKLVGATESDAQPKADPDERLTVLEDAFAELCEEVFSND